MSAKKDSAKKENKLTSKKKNRKTPAERHNARRPEFPAPTDDQKQIVANAMNRDPENEYLASHNLSTGKLPANFTPPTDSPRIQYEWADHGSLYHDTHHYQPSRFPTFLAALAGYEAWLQATSLIYSLRRYVLTFACGSFYSESPRHAFLVRKPPDSPLHANCLNLPGGKMEIDPSLPRLKDSSPQYEQPKLAALRELYEETGWRGSFPQLLGAIIPSHQDVPSVHVRTNDSSLANWQPYLVYIYRAVLNASDTPSHKDDAHAAEIAAHDPRWYLISDISKEKIVPNLTTILPLCASESRCWILQDQWQSEDFASPLDNETDQTLMHCQSQELLTFYPSDKTLEAQMTADGKPKKQCFTT